ncbi:MAG TPA: SMI1/KNR4 family protein [Polyangiaceae bacterium]
MTLDKLRAAGPNCVVKLCGPVADRELTALEERLGAPLPNEYRELLITHGVIYLDTDEGSTSRRDGLQRVDRSEVGLDYWFSFLWPEQALHMTTTLQSLLRDAYGNGDAASRLDRGLVFQQGYGDSSYYVFCANENADVSIYYVDGNDSPVDLTLTAKDFAAHIDEFIERWRRFRS